MTSANPLDPQARPRRHLTSQVLLGLIVIVVGVLFTLDNLNIIDADQYLQYWPAALVALGGLKLFHATRDGHGWFGGLVLVALGSWMLVERMTYIQIDARQLWPLFLVAMGGYMVWRGFGGARRAGGSADGHSHFSVLAIMGGVVRRSNSPTFEGADLTAVMGGCEIDLRQASMVPGGEAVIDVFAFWGGIDIKVPEDWTVIVRAIPLMGGVEDKTRVPPQPATVSKRLVIRGIVVMGGVVVKNSAPKN